MGDHQITIFFLLAAILGLGLYTVQPFLIPLAWAAILAYVTMPMYNRVLRLIGERPSVAAAISTLLLVLTIIVPVSLLLIRLQGEVFEAYREMSTKVANGDALSPGGNRLHSYRGSSSTGSGNQSLDQS